MCGIAGWFDPRARVADGEDRLRRMLALIRHRGPDEFGLYLDPHVGLGNARLSIVDLEGGQQPIANEDESLWIVFNGEIFNHVELRAELERRGHQFRTHTDTEVILHLFEDVGPECLARLNGQWALAIWDRRARSLFLARDRLGVRPLFYVERDGALFFGSEIKTLLAGAPVSAEIEPAVLDEIFTFWAPLPPRTVFRGIVELPPGHWLTINERGSQLRRFWQLDFSGPGPERTGEELLEEFRSLLIDATRLRLRADVPVGAYLSGGLDSSTIAAIIRRHTSVSLDTFSIAFDDAQFDESRFQGQMAAALGTRHQVVRATHADIGEVFPEVIWHTETPLLRTAPAPMFLLSRRVRDARYKVVLTGEGADEFLAGYDIFKEARVRRFWARQPQSRWRPLLFQRLYADIPGLARTSAPMLAAFFREGLTEVDAPDYSHAIRWRNGRRLRCFFAAETLRAVAAEGGDARRPALPAAFAAWGPLERAQFLEIDLFLSHYLLSSQGDRVAMAHSVEGRFPFLDHRVVEFCTRLPARFKLRALTEKYLLRQLGRELLPEAIWTRPKRPYRAPIHRSFFHAKTPDYVRQLLSPAALAASGWFRPEAVARLVQKIEAGRGVSEADDMALAGILSTQLVHQQFISGFRRPLPLSAADRVKVCRPNAVLSPP